MSRPEPLRATYPPRRGPTPAERALGAVLWVASLGFETLRRVRARRYTKGQRS